MRNDQIFVLLLVVLLPMSGCFDGGSVGEAEGAQDSDEASGGTTVVNHYYNNTTTSSNAQERTWYSSGGSYNYYWDDGQSVQSGQQRCVDYGPSYDQTTGEYVGEACRETAYPEQASDWNLTSCTENGGFVQWTNLNSWQNESVNDGYRYAPTCINIFKTISTSPGEALLVYEASGSWKIRTTCDGISSPSTYSTYSGGQYVVTNEYNIVQGSAMDCTHELYKDRAYTTSDSSSSVYLWSIVYAIQDTTVL
jgi:hypothetical protein